MLLVVLSVVFSVVSLIGISFYVNYQQVENAAGEELIGCASITTGLVDTDKLFQVINGDNDSYNELKASVDWIVDSKPLFKNAAVMSLNGELLIPDKRLEQEGFKAGDQFYIDKKVVADILEMKLPMYTSIYEYKGVSRQTGYAPIFKDHDPSQEIVALMAIDFDGHIVGDRTWQMLLVTIKTGWFFPVIAAIVAFIFVRRLVKPIIEIKQQMTQVANGNLRIAEITHTSRDEVGQLAEAFNDMVKSLKGIVSSVIRSSEEVAASTQQMAASTQEVTATVNEVSLNSQKVAKDAESGNRSAEETSTALLQLSSLIQIAKTKAQDAMDNSRQTLNTASDGKEIVSEVIERMNNIKAKTIDTEKLITSLDKSTKEITLITKTITDIAEQTNLLALNAAIEAARAGESGKGFAVVADEVRKLAEQSNQKSSEVASLVQQITKTTHETVAATKISRNEVEIGVDEVGKAGVALEEILQAVDKTVEWIDEIGEVTDDEVATSEKIVELINSLATFIETTAESAVDVSMSTNEASKSMDTIAETTQQLSIMASDLKVAADRFKL